MHIDCQFFDNTPRFSIVCRLSIPYGCNFDVTLRQIGSSGHCWGRSRLDSLQVFPSIEKKAVNSAMNVPRSKSGGIKQFTMQICRGWFLLLGTRAFYVVYVSWLSFKCILTVNFSITHQVWVPSLDQESHMAVISTLRLRTFWSLLGRTTTGFFTSVSIEREEGC